MKNLLAALIASLFTAAAFAGAPPSGNAPVSAEPPWEAPEDAAAPAKPAKKALGKKQSKSAKKGMLTTDTIKAGEEDNDIIYGMSLTGIHHSPVPYLSAPPDTHAANTPVRHPSRPVYGWSSWSSWNPRFHHRTQ